MKVIKVNFAENRKPAQRSQMPARVIAFPSPVSAVVRQSRDYFKRTRKESNGNH